MPKSVTPQFLNANDFRFSNAPRSRAAANNKAPASPSSWLPYRPRACKSTSPVAAKIARKPTTANPTLASSSLERDAHNGSADVVPVLLRVPQTRDAGEHGLGRFLNVQSHREIAIAVAFVAEVSAVAMAISKRQRVERRPCRVSLIRAVGFDHLRLTRKSTSRREQTTMRPCPWRPHPQECTNR